MNALLMLVFASALALSTSGFAKEAKKTSAAPDQKTQITTPAVPVGSASAAAPGTAPTDASSADKIDLNSA
ncbi:MAG: hypothetical protein H7249_07490 [Chitinophagaceae bacterium]|nr:hypothetical protein [Oligoflexus sp.]